MPTPTTQVQTRETLTLWRRDGDQITNYHLRRLGSEDWFLVKGEKETQQGQPGYRYTFERWVLDASTATLLQS